MKTTDNKVSYLVSKVAQLHRYRIGTLDLPVGQAIVIVSSTYSEVIGFPAKSGLHYVATG